MFVLKSTFVYGTENAEGDVTVDTGTYQLTSGTNVKTCDLNLLSPAGAVGSVPPLAFLCPLSCSDNITI
jgi:hypothetical protein